MSQIWQHSCNICKTISYGTVGLDSDRMLVRKLRNRHCYIKDWQVHHNLPLDDGGTNDFVNLVLINNDTFHKSVTNEQNSLNKGLSPKQSITIN